MPLVPSRSGRGRSGRTSSHVSGESLCSGSLRLPVELDARLHGEARGRDLAELRPQAEVDGELVRLRQRHVVFRRHAATRDARTASAAARARRARFPADEGRRGGRSAHAASATRPPA